MMRTRVDRWQVFSFAFTSQKDPDEEIVYTPAIPQTFMVVKRT
jgi:hypothetical protein